MIGKSIIAVSDVHLGLTIGKDRPEEEKHREAQFGDFLDTLDYSKISDFILLGDILDFWRHDYLIVIVDEKYYLDKFKELKCKHTNTNFHYIVGNHDYYLLWLNKNGADYSIDIKKSVKIRSKDEVFYFIHGYQFEVLSWSLYKSLALYENFCEDMCLIGEEGSRFADNLWKFYLEKITRAVKSPGSLKGFRTDKFEIYKLKELERDFESREISSHITPLTLTEEISCKSRELLSQIESTEKEQKLSGLSPEESYAIIKEIRK
ncbi:MAG: metallophosphoesterase [Methanosarcina flavescens]